MVYSYTRMLLHNKDEETADTYNMYHSLKYYAE